LKKQLISLELSAYSVAKSLSLEQSTVRAWFSGKATPSAKNEIKLQKWLQSLEK